MNKTFPKMSGFKEVDDLEIGQEDVQMEDLNTPDYVANETRHPSPLTPKSPNRVQKAIEKVIGEKRYDDITAYLNEKRRVLIRALLGEMLCTFLFLFTVMATHVNNVRINADSASIIGGVSTAFVSVALIYSFADVSGAHFNPAVTFATMVTKKTSLTKGALYIVAQLIAAVFASIFLFAIFPDSSFVVKNIVVNKYDDTNLAKAFFTEVILTFILVYVIFAVAFDTVDSSNKVQVALPENLQGKLPPPNGEVPARQPKLAKNLTIYTTNGNSKAGFAPIAIGFTLGFLCFIGGSTSGGAFNPARVFGPSLISGDWSDHWLYWLGDFMGAGLAGLVQKFFAHRPSQQSHENIQ